MAAQEGGNYTRLQDDPTEENSPKLEHIPSSNGSLLLQNLTYSFNNLGIKFTASARQKVISIIGTKITDPETATIMSEAVGPCFSMLSTLIDTLKKPVVNQYKYQLNHPESEHHEAFQRKALSFLHFAMSANTIINIPLGLLPILAMPEIYGAIGKPLLQEVSLECRLLTIAAVFTGFSTVNTAVAAALNKKRQTWDFLIKTFFQELPIIGTAFLALKAQNFLMLSLCQVGCTVLGTLLSYWNVRAGLKELGCPLDKTERRPLDQIQVKKNIKIQVLRSRANDELLILNEVKEHEADIQNSLGRRLASRLKSCRRHKIHVAGEMNVTLVNHKEDHSKWTRFKSRLKGQNDSTTTLAVTYSVKRDEKWECIKMMLEGIPGAIGDAVVREIFVFLLTHKRDPDVPVSFYYMIYQIYFTTYAVVKPFAQAMSYGGNIKELKEYQATNEKWVIATTSLISFLSALALWLAEDALIPFLNTPNNDESISANHMMEKYYPLLMLSIVLQGPALAFIDKISNIFENRLLSGFLDLFPQFVVMLAAFGLPAETLVLFFLSSWIVGDVLTITAGARLPASPAVEEQAVLGNTAPQYATLLSINGKGFDHEEGRDLESQDKEI